MIVFLGKIHYGNSIREIWDLEVKWSEFNRKYTFLEVDILDSEMKLYGTYRMSQHLNKIEMPTLPPGQYTLRIRQIIDGNVSLFMNKGLHRVYVEQNFFTGMIGQGSVHRFKVNVKKTLGGAPTIDYYWLMWNKIYTKSTPYLEMNLLKVDSKGQENVVKTMVYTSNGQGILRLAGVEAGEYILQIKSLGSGDDPARYAIGELENQLQPLTYSSCSIKRSLSSTSPTVTHTIIPRQTGVFKFTINPKDLTPSKSGKYNVKIVHMDDGDIVDLPDISANGLRNIEFNAKQFEAYTLSVTATNGAMEYEVGSTTEVGDQAIVEYYYQMMDYYINTGIWYEERMRSAVSVAACFGKVTQIQKYLGYTEFTAEQLNRYDHEILAWTNYWNDRAAEYTTTKLRSNRSSGFTWDFLELPPNLVKAVMFKESKVGNHVGNAISRGDLDPMQCFRDSAIKSMARKDDFADPKRDWGIPPEGIVLAILKNDKKIERAPEVSIPLGIRWLLWCYNVVNADIYWSTYRYNGNPDVESNGKRFKENYARTVKILYETGVFSQYEHNNECWSTSVTLFEP